MKCILFFKFNNSNYLFYFVDGKIKLCRLKTGKFVKVLNNDRKLLKDFIERLCCSNFDKKYLVDNNILVLDRYVFDKSLSSSKSTELSFSGKKRRIFLKNCASFYSNKKKFICVLTLAFSCFIFFFGYLFINSISNSSVKSSSNKDLLSEYTINIDKKIDYRFISIDGHSITNFNDSYIRFYNNFGKYHLISSGDINSYRFNDFNLSVGVIHDYYSNMLFTSSDFSDYSLVSLEDIFLKYDINDEMDLIYNCLLNIDRFVDDDSSVDDIVDKYVFDYYALKVVPYSESTSSRIIFFTGDKYGYAFITNNRISVVLKNESDQVNITFDNLSHMISDSDLIEFIYSLKFNY